MIAAQPLTLAELRRGLSNRDMAIAQSVFDFRFLSGGHLQVLHFDGEHQTPASTARSARRVLNRLVSLGVLRRLERRIGGVRAGSASFVYGLEYAGHRLVRSGHDRQGWFEPSITFLDHTLAIADVFVAVVYASKSGQIQLISYETEPKTWRSLPGYGATDTLRPDLRLAIGRDDLEFHWWVEVDRGSEHLSTVLKKCRQYESYWRSGPAEFQEVFPRVAWLTTTPRRQHRITEGIAGLHSPIPLFAVGLLDHPLDILVPPEGSP